MIEITLTVERELADGSIEEVEVTVCGHFRAGQPGVMYLANGDPGYPPEPDEVEIESATLSDGTPWELTESQIRSAEEKIAEKAIEAIEDRYDGHDHDEPAHED